MPASFTPWIAFSLLSRLASPAAPPSPIVNGRPAVDGELPMAGAILYEVHADPGDDIGDDPPIVVAFGCSSVLIAPDVVLTAAHCVDTGLDEITDVYWSNHADLTPWAGEIGFLVEPPADAITVIGSVAHPSFDAESIPDGLGHNYDIGLMFLERAVDIEPAWIPTEPDELAAGEMVVAVGWGVRDGVEQLDAGTKMIAESPIGSIGAWEFQVGAAKTDPRQCVGDSGGPALVPLADVDGAWRVVGIASHTWDISQCTTTGAVSTRVSEYRDWIEAQMIAACDDGTRVDCELPDLPTPAASGHDSGSSSDEGTSGDDTSGAQAEGEHEGCGCRSNGSPAQGGAFVLFAAFAAVLRGRRAGVRG